MCAKGMTSKELGVPHKGHDKQRAWCRAQRTRQAKSLGLHAKGAMVKELGVVRNGHDEQRACRCLQWTQQVKRLVSAVHWAQQW